MRLAWAAGAAGLVLVLSAVIWPVLDLDRDGLSNGAELRGATSAFDADSDGDGLPDGWEIDHGLDPVHADTDGDTLLDGDEVAGDSDPRMADTDGDGIRDEQEADRDCDGDGAPAVRDGDDDNDGLGDADDADACDPDQDGDGVLDGDEGAMACIAAKDCDGDGLDDGDEGPAGFDPLDPDTFDTGILDGVAAAFAATGQEPGPDDDRDGIPDKWESSDGLISWGPFDPQPGRRDLLVEFIHVTGPDSRRYDVDLDPAYEAVATLFETERSIDVQWIETTLRLDEEVRPGFLDEGDQDYFLERLEEARMSENPFVTSIFMQPQQEQVHVGDILGAAFIRGMLAVVDYGAHTDIIFEPGDSDGLTFTDDELRIRPVLESHIVEADEAKIRAFGFDAGGIDDGRFILIQDADNPENPLEVELTWSWDGLWFRTAPNVTTDDDRWLQFEHAGFELDNATLAATIAHELGHTLGLCHAHVESCYQQFRFQDQRFRHSSTMSYGADPDTLHFLGSEWLQVDAYITCPPPEPLTLLAEGRGQEVLDAKYGRAFSTEVAARECGESTAVEADLVPVSGTEVAAGLGEPPAVKGPGRHAVFGGASMVLAAGAAAMAHVLRRPDRDV